MPWVSLLPRLEKDYLAVDQVERVQ